MVLCPQHFQQQDEYYHHIIHKNITSCYPYFYGIEELVYDHRELSRGKLLITNLKCTMQDGTYCLIESNSPLSFDLEEYHDLLVNKPHKVYLSLPLRHDSPDHIKFIPREEFDVKDEFSNSPNADIMLLKPKPSITISPHESNINMPLIEITKTGGVYEATSYMPPKPLFYKGDIILHNTSQLASRIRKKANYLSDNIAHELDPQVKHDMIIKFKSIMEGLLILEHKLMITPLQPVQLYEGLLYCAGALSAITYKIPEIPPYNHHDIFESFRSLWQSIEENLEHATERYIHIPFAVSHRIFKLRIGSISGNELLIAINLGNMTDQALIDWVQNAIICSENLLTLAEERRILGASRKVLSREESLKLLPSKNMALVSIKVDPYFVQLDKELCIFNANEDSIQKPHDIYLHLFEN